MGAYTCPKGHSSTESDFCSDCGVKMQTAQSVQQAPAPSAGESCPECNAVRAPDGGSFCEVCGHNFAASGLAPVTAGPPATAQAAPRGWTATVMVDPALQEPDSPMPPAGIAPFTVSLDKVTLIGRRSESRAVYPEIALNFDTAVSHRHALLEQVDGGALILRDIGASNGTRLNGKDVTPLVDIKLHDGDQITLGHWTRITLKAVHG